MAGDFTTDDIDMGEVTIMNGASAASWMIWADLDTLPGGVEVMCGEVGAAFSDSSWGLIVSDGVFTGRTDQYGTEVTDGSSSVTLVEGATSSANTSGWQHVMSTYVGASSTGLRLYIDGSEDANSPSTTVGFSTIPTVTGGNTIGEAHNGANSFDGGLEWCTSWDSTLSAAKVTELNNGVCPFIMDNENITGCYPMWHESNLGLDISVNRNDGTVTGVTHATSRAPPVEMLENYL